MSYYKKNGFYDRLGRLSDWIDIQLSLLRAALFNGDNYARWHFTRIKRFQYLDLIEEHMDMACTEYDEISEMNKGLVYTKMMHYEHYQMLYDREKYWWMARR